MCQASTRLAAMMLLALSSLATAAGAVRAEAVVVAATAPGYTAGQKLGTDPITVPDGATLVFLLKTGQVVTVRGPYEGPPPAATGDAGNRFDRLTRLGGTDQAEIGGTRSLSAIGNVTRNLPLDLYLATDRGRHPVYRPGEPIRLVLQTNRDAHTYCWLKDTRRRVVPLFPSTAAEAQPLQGGLTLRACLKIQARDKTGYFLSNAIPMAPAWPLLTSGSGFRQSDPEQRNQANSMT
jgi:hypothetical protein